MDKGKPCGFMNQYENGTASHPCPSRQEANTIGRWLSTCGARRTALIVIYEKGKKDD